MPFPLELLTLGASSILGAIIKVIAKALDARRQERAYYLQALNAKAHILRDARAFEHPGISVVRGSIALTAVFFIIVFPKLVAVWRPEIPVFVGYSELVGGFWFFSAEKEKVIWQQLHGVVLTPIDTHLLSAIIGLYFGGALTR